jgi:hypothetical protein
MFILKAHHFHPVVRDDLPEHHERLARERKKEVVANQGFPDRLPASRGCP